MRIERLTETRVKDLATEPNRYRVSDTEQAGLVIEVMPTGRKIFRLRYRHEGAHKTFTIGTWGKKVTLAKAREIAKMQLGQQAGGIDIQSVKAEKRKANATARYETLRGFIDHKYKPWVLANRKSGQNTLDLLKRHFSHLYDREMSKITRWDLEKWREQCLGQGTKPSTINRNTTALKAVLNTAVQWEVIPSSQLTGIPRLQETEDHRVRFLSNDEEQRLRALALRKRDAEKRAKRISHNEWLEARNRPALPVNDDWHYFDFLEPVVLLSLNTGLRIGEVRKLRWDRVDFDRKQVTVSAHTAKSAKTRHVPLNTEALTALSDWHAQTGDKLELVFNNPITGGPFERNKRSWANLLERAGITNFRIHDMRHHFASRLVMAGVDLNTVRELLGHSDLKMTIRYAHLAPEHKAAAVERLVVARDNVVVGEFRSDGTEEEPLRSEEQ